MFLIMEIVISRLEKFILHIGLGVDIDIAQVARPVSRSSVLKNSETSVSQQCFQDLRDQCLAAVLSRLARPVSLCSDVKTCETSVSLQ